MHIHPNGSRNITFAKPKDATAVPAKPSKEQIKLGKIRKAIELKLEAKHLKEVDLIDNYGKEND
ncbi:hypothetical protein THIOSC15_2720015 [uncultured Thiomicrorhabdus sp.]